MATPTGLALLDRHRVEQGNLAATTAAAMLRVWVLLVEGGRVDQNATRWLDVVLAILAPQRARSATLATQYLAAYRQVELGLDAEPFFATAASALNLEQVRTSMSVTGPTAYRGAVAKQLGVEPRDLTQQQLADTRLSVGVSNKIAANSARAAMRHVQNGGRETTDDVLRNDPRVVGYARTTSATPCWFCAMLASRGPVYDKDSFDISDPRFHGPGDQKVHDGCGCRLEPLYTRSNPDFLERTREFEALWKTTGSALAFRRAFEGRGQ